MRTESISIISYLPECLTSSGSLLAAPAETLKSLGSVTTGGHGLGGLPCRGRACVRTSEQDLADCAGFA